jgi:hypothetical protein
MNKILCVYNICGLGGKDNSDHYISCIHSILRQRFDGYRLVISDCLNSIAVRTKLQKEFGAAVSYNWIDQKLTVNQTFNKTCQDCTNAFGGFEGYWFLDSGLSFPSDPLVIQKAYNLLKSGPYGIVSLKVDDDGAYEANLGVSLLDDKDYVIPIGKAVNGHTEVFSKEIYNNYDRRLIPDIFLSNCSESTFGAVAAGVSSKWVVLGSVWLNHAKSVDGASSGFGFPHPWDHVMGPRTIREMIQDGELYESGAFYECCNRIAMPQMDKYDENGFCKNPDRLRRFVLNNYFLSKDYLDYDNINREFTP